MPIRMLRDWTDSDKVNGLTVQAERFFVRLIMKVDDYGCFYANPALLKASCFPLLLDAVREADISRWMAECQKAGLIVLYEAGSKRYLQICDFKQRLDRAKAKFPLPPADFFAGTENQTCSDFPEVVNEFPPETETERKLKPNRAKALVVASDDGSRQLRADYEKLVTNIDGKDRVAVWVGVRQFIQDHKPAFIEPYMDAWNLFAISMGLVKQPQQITDKRRKKFSTRIMEPSFDFLRILEVIKKSSFLKGNNDRNWKVSIEFILESQENYTKILEEKYD